MPNHRIALAAGIAVLMFSLSLSPLHHSGDLQKQNIPMEQFGGGGTFEAQCSQSSFEDVFTYTWAEFNVTVADNWRTAQIDAMAWINGTMADDFRTFLDDLLDGLEAEEERQGQIAAAMASGGTTTTRAEHTASTTPDGTGTGIDDLQDDLLDELLDEL